MLLRWRGILGCRLGASGVVLVNGSTFGVTKFGDTTGKGAVVPWLTANVLEGIVAVGEIEFVGLPLFPGMYQPRGRNAGAAYDCSPVSSRRNMPVLPISVSPAQSVRGAASILKELTCDCVLGLLDFACLSFFRFSN